MASRTSKSSKSSKAASTAEGGDTAPETAVAEAQAADGSATGPAEGPARLSRRELINRIADETGVKKRMVRPVVDAMLRELGDALSEGKQLNLKPLGKAVVKRSQELPNGEVLVLRLRRTHPMATTEADNGTEEPLAEPAE